MPLNAHQQFSASLARFDHEVVDLDGTLNDLVRVLAKAVQQLKAEMVRETAVAPENRTVTETFAKRLKEVTAALSAATTCQNALYKTAKQRAAEMTPEQRQAALGRILLGLPYWDRRKLLGALCEAHNAKRAEALAMGVEAVEGGGDHRNPLGDTIGGGPSKIFVELA